jgi:hypothetical protein
VLAIPVGTPVGEAHEVHVSREYTADPVVPMCRYGALHGSRRLTRDVRRRGSPVRRCPCVYTTGAGVSPGELLGHVARVPTGGLRKPAENPREFAKRVSEADTGRHPTPHLSRPFATSGSPTRGPERSYKADVGGSSPSAPTTVRALGDRAWPSSPARASGPGTSLVERAAESCTALRSCAPAGASNRGTPSTTFTHAGLDAPWSEA